MANTVGSVQAKNLTAFVTQINALIGPLLANNIKRVEFYPGVTLAKLGDDLMFDITYDSSGSTITNPYFVNAFSGNTLATAVAAAQTFISSNPSFFFSPIFCLVNNPGTSRTASNVVCLVYNASLADGTANWLAGGQAAGAGSGTVTSVGLALPASVFVVSGSPVTTTGTLTGTLATQAANIVFAGPATGAAAAPTFRALVAADIPGGGTIGGTIAVNQVAVGSGANTIAGSAALTFNATSGTVLGTTTTTNVFEMTGAVANYAEINIQNTTANAAASADVVATADNGSATTHFVNMGINSSLGGGAPFTAANAAYLYSTDNELDLAAIGTTGVVNIATGAAALVRLTVGSDGGIKWIGIATVSAPATSGANNGTIYYDKTLQQFMASTNNGAYAALGGGGLTGTLVSGRVPFANGASSLTDNAAMTFSTASGFNVNRAVGSSQTLMLGNNSGNTTMTGANNILIGQSSGPLLTNGASNISIGSGSGGALLGGASNVLIGSTTGQTLDTGSGNILLGTLADVDVGSRSNAFVAGSNSQNVTSVWFGNGIVNASAVGFVLNGTGGTGLNKVGGTITIAGGISTGSGVGGSIILQTAPVTGSSSTPNTLTNRLTVGVDGGVKWTGIATTSAPATSGVNNGTIYYDSTLQSFMASVNNGAYAALGAGGGITGTLVSGRVPFANGTSSLTDSAVMTFSTASGLSVLRGGSASEFFGSGAGNATVNANNVTAVGNGAGAALTSGAGNTFAGTNAGANTTSQANCTFVGLNAGQNWRGATNVAIGQGAMVGTGTPANNTGTGNVVIGNTAMPIASTAASGVVIGSAAGSALTTASNSVFIGQAAGQTVDTQSSNVFIGQSAGQRMYGASNTAIGRLALIGDASVPTNNIGANNVAIGLNALAKVTTDSKSVAIGSAALQLLQGSTVSSVAIGANAGQAMTSGGSNVFLGQEAGDSTTITASNRFIVGSVVAPISTFFIGNGETATTPQAVVHNATGGSGANVAGAAFTLAGGIGTGTGVGGAIILQTAPVTGSSSTPNTLTNRLTVAGDGGVTWTGIATTSAPALSPVNSGTIYFDSTAQLFKYSVNGGAYATLGGGGGGGTTFADNVFAVQNSADATKQLEFSLGGMTTAKILTISSVQTTTQTLAIPNVGATDTIMTLKTNQTIAGDKIFNGAFTAAQNVHIGTYVASVTSGSSIAGAADGTMAAAGIVGEVMQVAGSAAAPGTGTTGNINSLPLTAGNWMVTATATVTSGATGLTAGSLVKLSVTTTTGADGSLGSTGNVLVQQTVFGTLVANSSITLSTPPRFYVTATGTTVNMFLTGACTYAAGSPLFNYVLTAIRVW